MQKTIDDVYNFLTGGLGGSLVDTFLSGVRTVFDKLLSFFYSLIFEDLKGVALNSGRSIFNFLFNMFGSQKFTLESLYYVFGIIFIIFVLKQTIHIIRG